MPLLVKPKKERQKGTSETVPKPATTKPLATANFITKIEMKVCKLINMHDFQQLINI